MVVDDVVFIIDKPITIDSLEAILPSFHLSFLFLLYVECVLWLTAPRAHPPTTKKKKKRLRSCPGSSSSVIRGNVKEQKVNKIPPFSFSFFLFSRRTIFSPIVVGSRGIKLETMKYYSERKVCWMLESTITKTQCILGALTLNELLKTLDECKSIGR